MEEFSLDNEKSTKWIDMYMPKTVNDIIGHNYAVMHIKDWLINYERNKSTCAKAGKKKTKGKPKPKKKSSSGKSESDENADDHYVPSKKSNNHTGHSCMTVTGGHGIGKTCSTLVILKSLKYTINTVNFSRIAHSKSPKEFATKMLQTSNIFNIVSGEKQKKIVVVIDDLESITSPVERKFIDALIKENEQYWSFPIIFISNNRHNKFINGVKSSTFEVPMALPKESHIEKLLLQICHKNQMILTSESIASMIIDHAQFDYRRLLTTLEDLYISYANSEITEERIEKYFEFSKRKDIDVDIYKCTETLFSDRHLDMEDRLIAYETERTILPLMVQQNHITCVNKYLSNKKHIFSLTENLTESVARGDVIENYIYGDQNWSLQETHGFYTCVYPTYVISNLIDETKIKSDIHFHYYRTDFPLDLNRTSIKHINVKNVKNAAKDFPGMNISDFINVKTILRKLLDEEKYDEYRELISGGNVTPAGVQAVIKVDKILDTKTNIPTSIIRRINQHT